MKTDLATKLNKLCFNKELLKSRKKKKIYITILLKLILKLKGKEKKGLKLLKLK